MEPRSFQSAAMAAERRPQRNGSRQRGTLHQRFWRYVLVGDGCWIWTGTKNENGYGVIGGGGRGAATCKAHRVSWEIHRGPVPAGMFLLHSCDNRACVRPDHLRPGTAAENMADCRKRGRSVHVTPGFVPTLSKAQVDFIVDAHKAGFSRSRLAEVFGVSGSTISRYVRGLARRLA